MKHKVEELTGWIERKKRQSSAIGAWSDSVWLLSPHGVESVGIPRNEESPNLRGYTLVSYVT